MAIKTTDFTSSDPALSVLTLLRSTLRSELNTIALAEVTEVDGGKVSVQGLVIEKESTHPPVIYHNVIVMFLGNPRFALETEVSPGDQGVLLTSKLDLTEYKTTKGKSKTTLGRVFDKNDSIFIPLLYNDKDLKKTEVTLRYHDTKVIMTEDTLTLEVTEDTQVVISKEGKLELKCTEVTCAPLKETIDALRELMDSLASGMIGSGTNATQYQADKASKLTVWNKVKG